MTLTNFSLNSTESSSSRGTGVTLQDDTGNFNYDNFAMTTTDFPLDTTTFASRRSGKLLDYITDNTNFHNSSVTTTSFSLNTTESNSSSQNVISLWDMPDNTPRQSACLNINLEKIGVNGNFVQLQQMHECIQKAEDFMMLRKCLEKNDDLEQFARQHLKVTLDVERCPKGSGDQKIQNICIHRVKKDNKHQENFHLCSVMTKNKKFNKTTSRKILVDFAREHCFKLFKDEHTYVYDVFIGDDCHISFFQGGKNALETSDILAWNVYGKSDSGFSHL